MTRRAPGARTAEGRFPGARGSAAGFVLVPHPTTGGLDGFDGFDGFVERVAPLPQERGAFRTEYRGATLRSPLGLPEPGEKG
ncbi:hypothetical protein ABZ626_25590 [Streptomyces longispororuber]|uniref:hypothetical protein n=1 Tax=Streptomyces longispororuber TaxID=68230 RepID=UPI0033EA23E7